MNIILLIITVLAVLAFLGVAATIFVSMITAARDSHQVTHEDLAAIAPRTFRHLYN